MTNLVSPALFLLEIFAQLEGGPCFDEALKIDICDDGVVDGGGGFCGGWNGGCWGGVPFGG